MTEERKEETRKKISEANKKAIICIVTGKIFSSVKEGGMYYNCFSTCITRCCKNKQKSAGKLPDGTRLKWMYLSDFLSKCTYTQL